MRVFISWSGNSSKTIGSALKTFLPLVLPTLDVWMSSADIPPGGLWKSELHARLSSAEFGVICVTKRNVNAPWLLYELGSLAVQVPQYQVIPILSGIEADEVPEPLSAFQTLPAHRDGAWKLLLSLNGALTNPLGIEGLQDAFDEHWPQLELEWGGNVILRDAAGVQVVDIRLKSLIDEHHVAMVRRRLQQAIENDKSLLVVDLSRVQYLSSAAIAAFLLNWKTAETKNGKLVFANVHEAIQTLFNVHGLNRIIDIHCSVDSAIEALAGLVDKS